MLVNQLEAASTPLSCSKCLPGRTHNTLAPQEIMPEVKVALKAIFRCFLRHPAWVSYS